MAAIAAIGLVAFCVYLVVQRIASTARDSGQQSVRAGPRWFEYLLAVLVLVAVIVAVVVVIVFLYPGEVAAGESWRVNTRSLVFLVAMLAIGTVALVAFLVGMIVRRRPANQGVEPVAVASEAEPVQTPAGTRLLGLLALVLALVLATKTLCRIQKAPVVTWLTMSQCTVRMVALAPRTSLDPPGFFSFSNLRNLLSARIRRPFLGSCRLCARI